MTAIETESAAAVALQDVIDQLPQLDFDDVDLLSEQLPTLLEQLARPAVLSELVRRFVADDRLRGMSERLAELDKLVLYIHPDTDVRVRMHIFRQGYWDRPHNHRFTFGTRILRGAYQHTVYGHATDGVAPPEDLLRTRLRRVEHEGDGYVIEHTLVHSVAAQARTVTLTVRGPAAKDAMLIVGDEGPFWAYGAKQETQEELDAKRLRPEHIDQLLALLRESRLVD